ncbi:MAG TPA: NAD-dependent epimerase/dehydratase family protein [Rhodocyclaceae bacterium]|nr:NAD-dependent epimerase/dehydratase family protein [Rhodocyclaceae bacterium]
MSKRLPEDDLDFVLSLTSDFWTQFRGARIFLTGASGFIGSWLLELILHANKTLGCDIHVTALSRDRLRAQQLLPHLFNDDAVQLVAGDMTTLSLPDSPIDLCIHAAADVADASKTAEHRRVFESAMLGTMHVLDLAERAGARRFLLTSSGAVYGLQPPAMRGMSESYAGAPDTLDVLSAYGQGKRAAEWLVAERSNRGNMRVGIARIFALIGPRLPLDGRFAVGNFIRDALEGRQITIHGDGTPIRSYLYIADVCVWLLRMMTHNAASFACNVGSEEQVSINELAELVREVSGSVPKIARQRTSNSSVLAHRYVPDTNLARRELDLKIFTPLRLALSKTINWHRMHNA